MLTVSTNAGQIAAEISRATDILERDMNELLVSLAFEIDGVLKKNTPVDTGNARNSWHFDVPGKGSQSFSNTFQNRRTKESQTNTFTGKGLTDETVVENFNTAPYINKLDHGSSAKSPQGMTIHVTGDFERIVRRAAENAGIQV